MIKYFAEHIFDILSLQRYYYAVFFSSWNQFNINFCIVTMKAFDVTDKLNMYI